MKIENLTFIPHRLMRRDRWQTATYSADSVDVFYVKIHTDTGITGLGAASVIPNRRGDPFMKGLEAVKNAACALFVGQNPLQIVPLMNSLHRAVPHYMRHKAGLEFALYDLMGKAFNVSVSTLLGGGTRELIPVIRMLSLGTPEQMAERALGFIEQGYGHLKVKLGTNPDLDLKRFRAVRRAVGPGVTLTADFNGAYDAMTAIEIIQRLIPEGLAMVEQPVPGSDRTGMTAVTEAVDAVVLADQAVHSATEAFQVAQAKAARAVSLKLIKFGGLQESLAVARVCEAAGLICHVGGTATSRLVEAAQCHFINATPSVAVPCEIGEFEALVGDLVEGLEIFGGNIRVPTGPGLGVNLAA